MLINTCAGCAYLNNLKNESNYIYNPRFENCAKSNGLCTCDKSNRAR